MPDRLLCATYKLEIGSFSRIYDLSRDRRCTAVRSYGTYALSNAREALAEAHGADTLAR
jgi:hypothetical protein